MSNSHWTTVQCFFFCHYISKNKVTNADALLIIKSYTWNKEAKLVVLLYTGRRKNNTGIKKHHETFYCIGKLGKAI